MKSNDIIFEEKSIPKILLKIAPPVMLAQLIQALYNIVDSYFVGRFSDDGLTALSVIFPIQLIITALAVGTGVGVNTLMSRYYAREEEEKANMTAGAGMVLALVSWVVFAAVSAIILKPFVAMSTESSQAQEYAVTYGKIVCVGSIGVFCEGIWTKVHQSKGNMQLPMIAQIIGAVTNIVLDPILIFGLGPIPPMGIAGAAYATVAGQALAALITISGCHRPPSFTAIRLYIKNIYKLGYPSILMQMLYTVYIVILNLILAGFSDAAVTVLGLYYKLQTFFFIPLVGLETCIVPFLSYAYTKKEYSRCKHIMDTALILTMAFMLIGVFCFEFLPVTLLGAFAKNKDVLTIGENAFRLIGLSFIPATVSLMMPIFFQAIGSAIPSTFLSLLRQIFCLIPIFWGFSKLGLSYTWLAFPLSESITGIVGWILYRSQLREWYLPVHRRKNKTKTKT